MSVEHQTKAPESQEVSRTELEAPGRERLEELAATPEQANEHQEKRAEAARETIHQQAEAEQPKGEAAAPASFVARINHVFNYAETLGSVQRRLKPVSRSFSQVVHSPAVEAMSEVLEKTVFRPSVTNGALWTAAVVGVFFYFVARHYGYSLSGSEILLSLLAGGLLGLAQGLGRLLLRRRP